MYIYSKSAKIARFFWIFLLSTVSSSGHHLVVLWSFYGKDPTRPRYIHEKDA